MTSTTHTAPQHASALDHYLVVFSFVEPITSELALQRVGEFLPLDEHCTYEITEQPLHESLRENLPDDVRYVDVEVTYGEKEADPTALPIHAAASSLWAAGAIPATATALAGVIWQHKKMVNVGSFDSPLFELKVLAEN